MNCLECQATLQRQLDGEALRASEIVALGEHCMRCVACRELHGAAMQLLEGIQQLQRPELPANFAQKLTATVLQDRQQRLRKVRRRVIVTMALAASVMFLLLSGYFWLPGATEDDRQKNLAVVDVQPKKSDLPDLTPGVVPNGAKQQVPDNTLASLTERWVDTTREHARVVLAATNLDAVEKLPAMNDLPELDPAVREVSQEVTVGVRVVTHNARRAIDFFTREFPIEGNPLTE